MTLAGKKSKDRLPERKKKEDNNSSGDGRDNTTNKKYNTETYHRAKRIHDEQYIFKDQHNTLYAYVNVKDHNEVLFLDSTRFERWVYRNLIQHVIDRKGNEHTILPKPTEVEQVLSYLKSMAEFDALMKPLHCRAAGNYNDGAIYYDLSNPRWQAIEVTARGWMVQDRPTMLFNRYYNQVEQVYPSSDYGIDILDKFMDLINTKNADARLLLKCYVIGLFAPNIPQAVLMLHGEPNSAKTTLLELIKMLVDPCITRTLTFKNDKAELAQLFSHNYIPYFDNLSTIPDWLSDAFCKAVTGDSISKRKLYTDNDDVFYTYMRCLGFSGVNLAATKPDLLSRGLIVQLERISTNDQLRLKYIWKEFEAMKPRLLGFIFDILVKVLAMKQANDYKVDVSGLPRLADWAEVCELISRCLGNKPGEFIEAYRRNVGLQTEAAIEDSTIAQAIIGFMEGRHSWEGTHSELLGELEQNVTTKLKINIKNHRVWPSQANVLSRRLKYNISNLNEVGISIKPSDEANTKVKRITITNTKLPGNIAETSIPSIPSILAENRAQIASDNSIDKSSSVDTVSIPNPILIQGSGENRAQNGPGIDDIDSIDNFPNLSCGDPIISTEEFFNGYCKDGPWISLPEHELEQSPCYPIIGRKRSYGNNSYYYCRLHVKIESTMLEAIEHHCKYQEPDHHESEIFRRKTR